MASDHPRSGAIKFDLSAADLVGRSVIVDVTYEHVTQMVPVRRRQFYGVVSRISNHTIVLRLTCGGVLHLPPELEVFRPAPDGNRRLPSTGELVGAADYIVELTADGPYGAGALRAVEAAGY